MKRIGMLIIAMIMVLTLSACAAALPEGMDKDAAIERAKQTVSVIQEQDYTAIVEELRDDLESQITPEALEEAWGQALNDAGAFKEYKSTAAVGQKGKSSDEVYAAVVLAATHDNGTLTYTIVIDQDMQVVGMYLK